MAPRVESEADWRLECGDIKQRGEHILQSGLWTDCTFLVGLGPDKVEIKAHKLILAMASPVFEAMFYGPIAEGDTPITVPDIAPDTFRKLLHYVYMDNIELNSFTSTRDIYYAADKYGLTHLIKKCTSNLCSNLDISPGIAGQTYEFNAKFICDKDLEEKSLKKMATHTKKVLNDSSFEELEINTVLKLFKMDQLNIDSELDLYAATERFTKALERRIEDDCNLDQDASRLASEAKNYKNLQSLGSEDNNQALHTKKKKCHSDKRRHREEIVKAKDKKRATIRDLLCLIRFLALTPREFAEYKTLSSLLTETEIMSLSLNIASSKTHVPMPCGFSVSTLGRNKGSNYNFTTGGLNSIAYGRPYYEDSSSEYP